MALPASEIPKHVKRCTLSLHSSSALRANHTAGTIPVHRSQADCEAAANPSRRHQETAMKLPAKQRILVLSAAVIVAACPGCEPPPPVRPAAPTPSATTPTTPSSATIGSDTSREESIGEAAPSARAIELHAKNWDEALAFVAEHKGKVVVVDVWSTSCEPCLQEFPHLVALQQRQPNDVVCISFACDFIGAKNKPVDYYRERVLKALVERKAETLFNLISTVPADELFQQMDLDSIPAVYVFDREGKLSKRFDNRTPVGGGEEGISYEKQIDPLVAELVKAGKR